MDGIALEMLRLSRKGYSCAQILILLALEAMGEKNPKLVRAMSGLAHGCGTGVGSCGVLTGGCCLISLYAAKGCDEEMPSDRLPLMLSELTDWFQEMHGRRHGGITCEIIVGKEGVSGAMQRCGQLVTETYAKVMEILTANDFDPYSG
jgi:hypothetical protein